MMKEYVLYDIKELSGSLGPRQETRESNTRKGLHLAGESAG